ncbi:MAG: AraC family transcriptional regulator [Myxococcota bacterium]
MHIPMPSNLVAWPAMVAVWGPGGQTTQHVHHGMHLIIALSGELLVNGETRASAGVFVPPDVPHAVDGRDAFVLTLVLEPESATGIEASARWGPTLRHWDRAMVEEWLPASIREAPTVDAVESWLSTLVRTGPVPMHPRIRRLLATLRERPLNEVDTSARALATEAGLSESRFLHVFRDSTGTPLRRYLLWLRLQRAAGLILTERSLTDAAFAAGFADAAHMSRTFRRLFGVAPSELLRSQVQTESTVKSER